MKIFNFPLSRKDRSNKKTQTSVCVVAILKNEDKFLDEWVVYHRLIGVDHLYLYDNDQRLPLKKLTAPYSDYVTVIDWLVEHDASPNPRGYKQIKAYNHFLNNFSAAYDWVVFIDADEFIVLRQHKNLKTFLLDFNKFDAVSLNWHVFGHNGYYNDPPGLVIASLTRRMFLPSPRIKTITKTKSIVSIENVHFCNLKKGSHWVDANKKKFGPNVYPGKTKVAHINHYQCRSFIRWMDRPNIGSAASVPADGERAWRFDEEKCLKQFVKTIAKDKNEFFDTYMLKYVPMVKESLFLAQTKRV